MPHKEKILIFKKEIEICLDSLEQAIQELRKTVREIPDTVQVKEESLTFCDVMRKRIYEAKEELLNIVPYPPILN